MPDATCSIDGCTGEKRVRGWCDKHYRRWLRTGDPTALVRIPRKGTTCSVNGCEREADASRGWCNPHYLRWMRHGDPEAGYASRAAAPAPVRFWAKVDKSDGCWLWTGACDRKGYGRFRAETGESVAAHRWVYEQEVGPIPEGLEIDHLCHSNTSCVAGLGCLHRKCVNPAHLEPVTHAENLARRNA